MTGPSPVRLEQLIGQARAAAVLRNAILRDRVAHAYLFCGPESVGKSTAALIFSQALNCETQRHEDTASPCGECRSCKLVAKRNHPDVRFMTPGTGGRPSVIPIEEIRKDLVYDVNLKPVAGRYKVYILDPAERTAHLAIHTILKVLEEPPPYVVTILVASLPSLLPPTIPSRCQQVHFQLAGTEAIESHLLAIGVEPAAAASLARLSGGRVAWAVRAAHCPDVLSVRKALLDLCAGLDDRGLPASLRVAEEIKLQALALASASAESEADAQADEETEEPSRTSGSGGNRALRTELPWCLDVMISWYRDRLAAPRGGALLNPDYEAALRGCSRTDSARGDEQAIESLLEVKHAIQRNANLDLSLECLATRLIGGSD